MYRVLLVDDDVAVLEFLRKLIPWKELGFELTGAFANAPEALAAGIATAADLVITDIGMPGMDGLTLIKELQQRSPHTRYIILSCHDEFHYAQQAVQLGVQEYMLKETLDVDGMKAIVGRVKPMIDEDRRRKLQVERLNLQAVRSKSAWKENWLRNLLANPAGDDRAIFDQLKEYGLDTSLGRYIPAYGSIRSLQNALRRYENEEMVKFVVANAAEDVLAGEPNAMFFGYSASGFVLLYACKKDLAANPYDALVRISRELQQAFAKYLKIELSVIVGEMESSGSDVRRQLPGLIASADSLFYSDRPELVKSREIRFRPAEEDLFAHYSEYADRLNRLLLEENRNAEPVIDAFVDFVKSRKFPPSDVKQFVWKLALDLQLKLKFNLAYDKEKMQQAIGRMMNVCEARNWLVRFMKDAVVQVELISKSSKKSEIIDARKYVQLHLDRKISLEEVADQLHLNPSYFSRLFKKETGENFIEYVNRMKMEKAMALLSESDSTVEKVALMLGYDNKSYFNKLFKQHFEVSPSKYYQLVRSEDSTA